MSQVLDPRIGILSTAGGLVYYAFVDGYDKPEFRGSLDAVEVALGIRPAPAPAPIPAKKRTPVRPRRTYAARVISPDGTVYKYETQARNKTEARTEIRRLFRIDVPSPKNSFYSFEEHRLEWIEEPL